MTTWILLATLGAIVAVAVIIVVVMKNRKNNGSSTSYYSCPPCNGMSFASTATPYAGFQASPSQLEEIRLAQTANMPQTANAKHAAHQLRAMAASRAMSAQPGPYTNTIY